MLFNIISSILNLGSSFLNNAAGGILLYSVVLKLLLSPLTSMHFKSLKAGEALQTKVEKETKSSADKTLNEEQIKALIDKGYRPFSYIAQFILYVPFAFILSLVYSPQYNHLLYRTSLEMGHIDLSQSILTSSFNVSYGVLPLVLSLIIVISAMVSQYIYQTSCEALEPVKHVRADLFILVLVGIGGATMNIPASLYWTFMKIMDMVQLKIYDRYYKVDFSKPKRKSTDTAAVREVRDIRNQMKSKKKK